MSKPNVKCPKCGAMPAAPCRTAYTNRATDTHAARWDALNASEGAKVYIRGPIRLDGTAHE